MSKQTWGKIWQAVLDSPFGPVRITIDAPYKWTRAHSGDHVRRHWQKARRRRKVDSGT